MANVVLSAAELQRIKTQVLEIPPDMAKKQEREYLKKLSDERATQWPNTIEAQRARKEKTRLDRLDAEEEVKKQIDVQEAKLKAEARQLQIERANKMLYDETDKVKSFHSSLLLSDVLQEREAQIAYKASQDTIKKKHEAKFVKEQERALEIAELAEQKKWEEKRTRALAERDAQLDQLEQLKGRLLEEKAENFREGQMLKQKAEEEMLLTIQKEERKRQAALDNNFETLKANEALKAYKELEYMREVQMEKKIAEFAKSKEKTLMARKAHEQAKRSEAQRKRDKMLAVMEADLLKRQTDANVRLSAQADEARMAEDAREAIREAERAEEREMIDRSRKQQLDIRRAQKAREKEEEMAFVSQWKVRNEQLKLEEEMEKISQFTKNKRLQDAHLRAMDRKLAKAQYEKGREMEDALATQLIAAEDAELFKHYTAVCMEEWKTQGKNLTPMLLEITKKEKVTD